LLGEILGHGGAVGFVAFVFDFGKSLRLDVELADGGDGFGLSVAESFRGDIEDGGEIGGRKIVAQLAQHVDEDENRRGGIPDLVTSQSAGAPWRDRRGR